MGVMALLLSRMSSILAEFNSAESVLVQSQCLLANGKEMDYIG